MGNLFWGLFATEPAKTEIHIDAGGLCTWVQILTGAKIWCIRRPCPQNDEVDLGKDKEGAKSEWGVILLLPGDKL